jgi:aspartyl protease family protein
MRANIELNAQLANTGRQNVFQHNQLVAAVNANASAMNLMIQDRETSKKEVDEIRRTANTVRENYVQRILQVRALVDRVSGKYAELAKDDAAQAALKEWNEAADTSYDIKPSRTFQSQVKRLEALERSVITENISLRREGNNFHVPVVINGKHVHDMMIDTGASSIAIPYKVAMDCGLNVDESSLTVTGTIADGSKVKSKLVILDSVRVGKFSAENVECMVFPPEAKDAPLLLGMSFLGRFNFSMNGSEMVLSKIDAETPATAKPKKPATRHTTKRPTRRTGSN